MHPERTRRREAELVSLGKLMRERVGLPPSPVPVPLHRMAVARSEREGITHGERITHGEGGQRDHP